MKTEKGFTITISTILIVITITWFSMFYAGLSQKQESNIYRNYPIEKAGFVADDIIWDVNLIMGISVNADRNTNFMHITISDKLPADINKLQLIDYNKFIDANYSQLQNASIDLNFNSLIDGKAELLFSNGLVYEHQYEGDQNFVRFYRDGGADTGVFTYDINIFVQNIRYDEEDSYAWECDSEGDVNVNLRYIDSYGETVNSLCQQDSSQEYEYEFSFIDVKGGLVVIFGDVQGNENSVKVRDNIDNPMAQVIVSIGARLASPAEEVVWYYDADLNYSQGDVELDRKIELGRS